MGNRLLWPDLAPADAADGWLPDPGVGYRSIDVLAALENRYTDYGGADFRTPAAWVFLREVQEQTGVYGDAQRFDAVAVGLVPSVKYARIIFEVKVSRADWLRELKPRVEFSSHGHRLSVQMARNLDTYRDEPWLGGFERRDFLKWESGLALSTEFYFASPPRCIMPSEVPEGCGLIEVRRWGADQEMRARTIVKAPVRETPNPGPEFWAAVLRRAATRPPRDVT